MYSALMTTASFKTVNGWEFATVWDYTNDGGFGVIGNQFDGGDMTRIDVQGWYLGKACNTMIGQEVATSTTLANLLLLGCKSGNNFAIQIINYNTSGSYT